MTMYQIGQEVARLIVRIDRLERKQDACLRLINRTGLVAAIWIVAVLIAAYSGQAALATAAVFAKLIASALR